MPNENGRFCGSCHILSTPLGPGLPPISQLQILDIICALLPNVGVKFATEQGPEATGAQRELDGRNGAGVVDDCCSLPGAAAPGPRSKEPADGQVPQLISFQGPHLLSVSVRITISMTSHATSSITRPMNTDLKIPWAFSMLFGSAAAVKYKMPA